MLGLQVCALTCLANRNSLFLEAQYRITVTYPVCIWHLHRENSFERERSINGVEMMSTSDVKSKPLTQALTFLLERLIVPED